jgi:hypothetical protein
LGTDHINDRDTIIADITAQSNLETSVFWIWFSTRLSVHFEWSVLSDLHWSHSSDAEICTMQWTSTNICLLWSTAERTTHFNWTPTFWWQLPYFSHSVHLRECSLR